jgi:hypothetical protein
MKLRTILLDPKTLSIIILNDIIKSLTFIEYTGIAKVVSKSPTPIIHNLAFLRNQTLLKCHKIDIISQPAFSGFKALPLMNLD